MKTASRHRRASFKVIGQNSVNKSWDGSPITLNPYDSASMPVTPNYSMVFAYINLATSNNMGQLALTSGGSAPLFLNVPALTNQPNILVNSWHGNNLNVTNISAPGLPVPIAIAAYAPGLPWQECVALPSNGNPVTLAQLQCAQGHSSPGYMQLILQESSGQLAIFVLIGGPMDSSGNNAYVIAVNSTEDTGPGTGKTPPPGYYATTTTYFYTFQFNWGVSRVYVANMSAQTSAAAQVALRQL